MNQPNAMNEPNPNPRLAGNPASPEDSTAGPGAGSLQQAAVLVVDDSRTMRLGLIHALNTLGFHNITEAINGRQALELVLTKSFDLMLLDMEMPEMNGMEVLAALKANPDMSELPVIVISGAEQIENAVKCIELGAEDFLPKPFNPTLLRARVTSSLERKRLRDAMKEQIASELRVASEIQMGMLPHDFMAFEQAYGVAFGAVLEPAREVGGDLYGVCAAAPERLVVFLGDVSGKGIPASMFMVRAISLARLLARDIAEPERILARLNDELAVDNPSGMFVTFLCAVFDPRSGRLVIANGGHCRPVLLRAGAAPVWAVKRLGTALGFEPGLEFERTELTLPPGDSLIFYSDGVSEAFNPQDECYGDARLLADAGALAGQSPEVLTAGLLKKVHAYAGTAPQSDDIAILTLKVQLEKTKGTENSSTQSRLSPVQNPARVILELHATPEEVMRAVEALQEFAAQQGVPEKTIFGLALALEECGSNVVNHALQRDAQQKFQVIIERAGDLFAIELRDGGPAFDPTAAVPRQPQAADDDLPGGWGIGLVRRKMDEIRYQREAGENVLRLTKRLVSAVSAE